MANKTKAPNQATLKESFEKMKDDLSRSVNGISASMEDKYFTIKDNGSLPLIEQLINTYTSDDNITEIKGKQRGVDINKMMYDKLSSKKMTDIIAKSIHTSTSENIREHKYLKRYMPQLSKVLNDIVEMILVPNTHVDKCVDIDLNGNPDITVTEINDILSRVEFEDVLASTVQSAIDHGAGFMYVYPYKKIAEDIMSKIEVDPGNTSSLGGMTKLYNETISNTEGHDADVVLDMSTLNDLILEVGYDNGDMLFAESVRGNDDYKQVYDQFFSESPIVPNMVASFKNTVTELYSESGGVMTNRSLNKITGAYVETLDNEKIVPVYINNKLVGVYHIGTDNYRKGAKKGLLSSNNAYMGDESSSIDMNVKVIISDIIKDDINEKFLVNNQHVLSSIDSILTDIQNSKRDNCTIKFIPAEYIVEFPNFYRTSQMELVEALAHYWIQLSKNYIFKKLFYERDKLLVKYPSSIMDDDMTSGAYRLMKQIENIIPNPADILNLRKMNMGLINNLRAFVPRSKKGTDLFDITTLEGESGASKDMEDLEKWQGIITNLLGFSYNMYDPSGNTDYALNLVMSDQNKANAISSWQKRFVKPLGRAVNMITEFEIGAPLQRDLKVKFPELQSIQQQVRSDALDKVVDKISKIKDGLYSDEEDPKLVAYATKHLFIKYASAFLDIESLDEEIRKKYNLDKTTGDNVDE